MRFYVFLLLITAVLMVVVPAASLSKDESKNEQTESSLTEAVPEAEDTAIAVFMTETESILTLDREEYLIGAVASEMPASYHIEALKAQALACKTYAEYVSKNASDDIFGADISNSPKKHQGYITKQERKTKWGENFEVYEEKIRSAVNDVIDETITFDGEPVMSVFFSMCPGKTEDAETVFGKDIPYLKSVISDGDKLSPDYSKKINFTVSEFKERISSIDGITVSGDPEKWISEIETSDVGTVKTLNVCGREIDGSEFRDIFSLRSSAFTVSYSENSFTVKTVGYGHFVGMSQYGADYSARQGSTYEEILKHYYSGVTISGE